MDKNPLIERIKQLTSPLYPEQYSHKTHLKKLAGIKCVALDFYGTMFISGAGDIGVDEEQKSSYKRHLGEALNYIGFSVADEALAAKTALDKFNEIIEAYIKQKKEIDEIEYPEPDIAVIWEDVLVSLKQLGMIKGPINHQQAIRFAIEYEFRTNTIWPLPELVDTLNDILNQNCRLGIISNSQFYTPLAFEALIGQTADDFGFDPDLQKWSYINGIKKPSLGFYRQFSEELPAKNLKPGNVLFVGNDLFKDILPTKELGMKTALYIGDKRSLRHKEEDLTPENQPDIIVDGLQQIPGCLA
jgi:putative hydrolase of the HAD superfamily